MDKVWKRVVGGAAELKWLATALDAAAEARDEALVRALLQRASSSLAHVEWTLQGAAPSLPGGPLDTRHGGHDAAGLAAARSMASPARP